MKLGSRIFRTLASMAPRLRGFTQRFYFGHPFLDAWFAWFPLNQIQYEGAAVGEIYNVAARIDERSNESWTDEWMTEGNRVRQQAEDLLAAGHERSGALTSLRAYTYYRTSHLATDPDLSGSAMRETYSALKQCYALYVEHGPRNIVPIVVPFEDQDMSGYFISPGEENDVQRPTVLWLNGAESISEDMLWWCGAEGAERGFNVAAVDMPGDTATRIDRPSLRLSDPGDAALKAQIDYLLSRPDVHPDQLFVYGISMGGYKAARLAGFDERPRAIAANAPMLNAASVLADVRNVYKMNRNAHGWAYRMCWQYGIDDRSSLKQSVGKLLDEVWGTFTTSPEAVRVPFLTLVGENELGGEGLKQAREFHARIQVDSKVERVTTLAEGAEAHCQLNNFPLARQIVFDWFEDHLAGSMHGEN